MNDSSALVFSLILLVVGLILFHVTLKGFGRTRRRLGRPFYRAERAARLYDAAKHASYRRKRVMNRGEYRVFSAIERAVQSRGFRVFAQTSLGELLETADADAFAAINSKRADIVVINSGGFAVAVFEVQGTGHSLNSDTRLRDMTKRAALESAGVAVVEVTGWESEDEIASRLARSLASTALGVKGVGQDTSAKIALETGPWAHSKDRLH
jgi:Protein of unknown function (DUF2726)